MAFERERVGRPVAVGEVSIVFTTLDANAPMQGVVHAQLLDADGNIVRRPSRDLAGNMTDAQINSISNFLANVRTRIENEVLPDAPVP